MSVFAEDFDGNVYNFFIFWSHTIFVNLAG